MFYLPVLNRMTWVQSKTVSFSVGKVAGVFGSIGGLTMVRAAIGWMPEVLSPPDISDHSSTPVSVLQWRNMRPGRIFIIYIGGGITREQCSAVHQQR